VVECRIPGLRDPLTQSAFICVGLGGPCPAVHPCSCDHERGRVRDEIDPVRRADSGPAARDGSGPSINWMQLQLSAFPALLSTPGWTRRYGPPLCPEEPSLLYVPRESGPEVIQVQRSSLVIHRSPNSPAPSPRPYRESTGESPGTQPGGRLSGLSDEESGRPRGLPSDKPRGRQFGRVSAGQFRKLSGQRFGGLFCGLPGQSSGEESGKRRGRLPALLFARLSGELSAGLPGRPSGGLPFCAPR